MKIRILSIFCFLVLITSHAKDLKDDLKMGYFVTYDELLETSVSDELINAKISRSMKGGGKNEWEETIFSLGIYAEKIWETKNNSTNVTDTTVIREVKAVEGLRDNLIRHFSDAHKISGYDAYAQAKEDIESGFSRRDIVSTVNGNGSDLWLSASSMEEASILIKRRFSSWLNIPIILSVLWQEDLEVHEFIWQYYKKDRSMLPYELLYLLNAGNFKTHEANEFRIEQLYSATDNKHDINTIQVVSLAAKGLAFSHPEDAIPALLEAGREHIQSRGDVVITLAGYKNSQLDPYYDELVPLVLLPRWSFPEGELLDLALERLVPYASGKPPGSDWIHFER